MTQTPIELGMRFPAEWENHRACWLAWPWDGSLWQEDLAPAQAEFVQLCHAIQKESPTEWVYLVCPSPLHRRQAERALGEGKFRFFEVHYGDIWLRDTAPLFVTDGQGGDAAVHFKFNGWGGKYSLKGDDTVGQEIARFSGLRVFHAPWILEGGSIETNGQGLCLTTKQCLLNPNRNPGMSQGDIENGLRKCLGQEKVLWLDNGLINDHTDGHIDNLARFVSADTVVCMRAETSDDPNREVLAQIENTLRSFTDREGKSLQVVSLPSPGRILDGDGKVRPASYMNFYIANGSVIVPLYGAVADETALAGLKELFPQRKVVGFRADHILSGGGSFHCITQQFPGLAPTEPADGETEEEANDD